jgi:hypothetical protein
MFKTAIAVVIVAAMLLAYGVVPVAAHPHTVSVSGQVIANGQNHPKFEILSGIDFNGDGVIEGLTCESFGAAAGGPLGPAWFGLETAHHGPDGGSPGKADGCYRTTGGVLPGDDVPNPVIR